MAKEFRIRPLRLGDLVDVDHGIFTLNRNQGVKLRSPVIAWVIEGEGHQILVDTGGFDPEAEPLVAQHHTRVQWPKKPLEVFREAGVEPSEIKTVILTHLHWDHCWNLELFPNAEFVVQQRELRYAVDPLPVQRAIYDMGLPGVVPPWSRVLHRMRVVDGDREVVPGVHVHLLPGHSPGLQGVGVETRLGYYLIGGDNVALYWNWEQRHPSGHYIDLNEYYRTFDKMAAIADVVFPGHDPQVFDDPRLAH